MKTIEYIDFEKKLKELNKDIYFDETEQFKYPYDESGRTGIMLKNEHLCNISRGTIREENTFGRKGFYTVVVDANEALLEHNRVSGKYVTNKYQLTESVPGLWAEANKKLMGADRGIFFLGGLQVTGERIMGHTATGEFVHNIIVNVYTKQVILPATVIRIGWRDVLRTLMNKRIPGLHREALEKAFGVELGADKKAGKSLEEIVKETVG
jgi:hypothetical protein